MKWTFRTRRPRQGLYHVRAPELDNVIANLKLMPQRMNASKNATVGQRQRALAEKFYTAGLLSTGGLKAVQQAQATD